jgi:hypothetical protein
MFAFKPTLNKKGMRQLKNEVITVSKIMKLLRSYGPNKSLNHFRGN